MPNPDQPIKVKVSENRYVHVQKDWTVTGVLNADEAKWLFANGEINPLLGRTERERLGAWRNFAADLDKLDPKGDMNWMLVVHPDPADNTRRTFTLLEVNDDYVRRARRPGRVDLRVRTNSAFTVGKDGIVDVKRKTPLDYSIRVDNQGGHIEYLPIDDNLHDVRQIIRRHTERSSKKTGMRSPGQPGEQIADATSYDDLGALASPLPKDAAALPKTLPGRRT